MSLITLFINRYTDTTLSQHEADVVVTPIVYQIQIWYSDFDLKNKYTLLKHLVIITSNSFYHRKTYYLIQYIFMIPLLFLKILNQLLIGVESLLGLTVI